MNDTPRIYVASLAAYNAGILHGAWIDADADTGTISAEIAAMLATDPEHGEEYAIHDYDNFAGLATQLGEYPSLDDVVKHATMLAEHGDAWAAYVDHVGAHYATSEGFEESYRGEWDSEEDYAENLFDDIYGSEVPEFLAPYIDYAKFSRDLFLGDYYAARLDGGMVAVFSRD